MNYGFIDDIGDIMKIFSGEYIDSTKEKANMCRKSLSLSLLRDIISKEVFNTPICKFVFRT